LHVDLQRGIVAVADGMGGHSSGEVASSMAVRELEQSFNDHTFPEIPNLFELQNFLGETIEKINQRIVEQSQLTPQFKGMGTTLVAGLFQGPRLYYAHIGDSRLYRLRAGRLRCLTKDHSLIQEMVDKGVFENKRTALEAGVKGSVLTRCLGIEPEIDVDVDDAFVEKNDLYLLCSDGLNGFMSDKEIKAVLRTTNTSLGEKADDLITAALDNGGNDNVTVVLVHI